MKCLNQHTFFPLCKAEASSVKATVLAIGLLDKVLSEHRPAHHDGLSVTPQTSMLMSNSATG